MLYGLQTKALINYKYQMSGPVFNSKYKLQTKFHTNERKEYQQKGFFVGCVGLLSFNMQLRRQPSFLVVTEISNICKAMHWTMLEQNLTICFCLHTLTVNKTRETNTTIKPGQHKVNILQ